MRTQQRKLPVRILMHLCHGCKQDSGPADTPTRITPDLCAVEELVHLDCSSAPGHAGSELSAKR